ncbi:group I truncated hemoglobin [Caulobacter hibisci]|uniref:Group 1 truncated hemoglobin n=1 Tax=Caulobacter hibisci TaxID=2035993 RepID=A0ABS0T089_9CAUL|nr:group 1 truncated hemoglobin [Caulobacter hibisci]MBI1685301.1 group 1 truncated hemoglobin [Caulobacter hibisci]
MIRHNALRSALAAGFALSLSGLAQAQDVPPGEQPVDPYVQSNANAGATPLADKATFEAFHGKAGLARIASDLVDRNLADPRIKDIFATADTVRLKRTLTEQFCYVLGGGCDYTGKDMTQAHKDQGITGRDFNALVENLQWAMDKEGVPFAAQNKLLAKLAPMARQTIERK